MQDQVQQLGIPPVRAGTGEGSRPVEAFRWKGRSSRNPPQPNGLRGQRRYRYFRDYYQMRLELIGETEGRLIRNDRKLPQDESPLRRVFP